MHLGEDHGPKALVHVALPCPAVALAPRCRIRDDFSAPRRGYARLVVGGGCVAVVAALLLLCIDDLRGAPPPQRIPGGDAAVVQPPRSVLPRMIGAVQSRSAEQVRRAFQEEPDVNEKDPRGRTALHRWAMSYASPGLGEGDEIFRMLIAMGADANARDDLGATPLHEAFRADAVRLLVAAGADVNARDCTGSSPLHRVASAAHEAERVDAVRLLLDGGARVDATDHHGLTPLHIAAAAGDVPLARLLVSRGAGVNARDRKGRTPAARAQMSFREEMVKYLQSVGGPP